VNRQFLHCLVVEMDISDAGAFATSRGAGARSTLP
jgi:hypothetical protein